MRDISKVRPCIMFEFLLSNQVDKLKDGRKNMYSLEKKVHEKDVLIMEEDI